MSDKISAEEEDRGETAVDTEGDVTRSEGVKPEETAESAQGGLTLSEDPMASDYFDDDLFLAAEDHVLHRDQAAGIVEQLEHVVSWQVDNFFADSGKPRSKFVLRQDPPIFKISSSRGDVAEFIVTKSLARDLEQIFKDVHNGFYGISPKTKSSTPLSQESISQAWQNVQEWAVDNKVKAVIAGLVVLFLILSPFILN